MGIKEAYNRLTLKWGLRGQTNSEELDGIYQDTERAFEALSGEQQDICRVLMANINDGDLEQSRYQFFSNLYTASLFYETQKHGLENHTQFSNSMQAPSVDTVLKTIRDVQIDQDRGLEKDRGYNGQEIGVQRKAWYLSRCIKSAAILEPVMKAYDLEMSDMFEKTLSLVQQKNNGQLIHFYDGAFENDQYSFRHLSQSASKAFYDPNYEATFEIDCENAQDDSLMLTAGEQPS